MTDKEKFEVAILMLEEDLSYAEAKARVVSEDDPYQAEWCDF